MFSEKFTGDPAQLPSLTLAYIGDAVFELYIRNRLISQGFIKVHSLHQEAVKRVNACLQARLLENIENELTEAELAIAKRGRNAKSGHVPKNAEVTEYRKSTGLETLVGYLYLKGDYCRIEQLLSKIDRILDEC
ncbi:MAG: ribonuclease III [Clostridia bacterium]|nr:ribonuclease III [Clostridia bacterium]